MQCMYYLHVCKGDCVLTAQQAWYDKFSKLYMYSVHVVIMEWEWGAVNVNNSWLVAEGLTI